MEKVAEVSSVKKLSRRRVLQQIPQGRATNVYQSARCPLGPVFRRKLHPEKGNLPWKEKKKKKPKKGINPLRGT